MYLVQTKHFWSLGFLFVPGADNPVTFPPLSSWSPKIDISSSVDRVQLQRWIWLTWIGVVFLENPNP